MNWTLLLLLRYDIVTFLRYRVVLRILVSLYFRGRKFFEDGVIERQLNCCLGLSWVHLARTRLRVEKQQHGRPHLGQVRGHCVYCAAANLFLGFLWLSCFVGFTIGWRLCGQELSESSTYRQNRSSVSQDSFSLATGILLISASLAHSLDVGPLRDLGSITVLTSLSLLHNWLLGRR